LRLLGFPRHLHIAAMGSQPCQDVEEALEEDPLLGDGRDIDQEKNSLQSLLIRNRQVIFWGFAVVVASTALIDFNKYLMQPGRFPYSIHLVMLHSSCGTFLAGILRLAFPELFPTLTDPFARVHISTADIFKSIFPIAALAAMSLVFSNTAYMFASVAFLQMMKQGNVIIVYIFSIIAGLEVFRTASGMILLSIVFATMSTVHGEIHFSKIGFIVQLLCGTVESLKVVLQGTLLSGSGKKLDPLSFVLFVSPLIFVVLTPFVCLQYKHPDAIGLPSPRFEDFVRERWYLAGNVLLAFALNVISSIFLKYSSPIAFLLVHIVKDVMIVVGDTTLMGEAVSRQQRVSFVCQLGLISLWSMTKSNPEMLKRYDAMFSFQAKQQKA
jgi:hypothetical protein